LGRFELLGIGLVAVQRGFVQRQGVEHFGVHIVRILARQPLHRFLIVERARVLVDLIVVLVDLLNRRQPVALALGLGADRLALFDGIVPALQRRCVPRANQWVRPYTDGQAPVGNSTARIDFRDLGEGRDRFWVKEGVQHAQRALECLLRLRRARSLEQYSAELLAFGLTWRGSIVLVGQRTGGAYADNEAYSKYQACQFHDGPPRVMLACMRP